MLKLSECESKIDYLISMIDELSESTRDNDLSYVEHCSNLLDAYRTERIAALSRTGADAYVSKDKVKHVDIRRIGGFQLY